MSGFDLIVLFVVGVAAVGGFLRGFVQEVLSLLAWFLAIAAIHYMHTDLTGALMNYYRSESGSAVLAFALLLLIPYAAMKLIAGRLGETTRTSILGPIDRVLGFGFGAIKGAIIIVLAFSLLVLGYDTVWGIKGRPEWITQGRTYQVVNAGANALVQLINDRRQRVREADEKVPEK